MAKWLNRKAKESKADAAGVPAPGAAVPPAPSVEAPSPDGMTVEEQAPPQEPAEPDPGIIGIAPPGQTVASVRPVDAIAGSPPAFATSDDMPSAAPEKPILPRLYIEFAEWWPILSQPSDYAEEAAFYTKLIEESCSAHPSTVLELGSGGGSNASHMKARFRLTLVDLSPGMIAVSSRLNPECEHIQGDMRDIRLNLEYDSVFVHDAVSYISSLEDLARVAATAFVHCRPGGAALFCPDFTRETFRQQVSTGGRDADGRSLRYIEWTRDPDPADSTYTVDFAYMLLDRDGPVRVEPDSHVMGLFSREEWLRILSEAGFEAKVVPFLLSEAGSGDCGVVVGLRPLPPLVPPPPPPDPEPQVSHDEPDAPDGGHGDPADPFSILSQPTSIDWGDQE
jgi:SAM-dependent methyltransferase